MTTEQAGPPDRDEFGAHVKRLREVRRLSQEELASRSGLAADTIRRLEHLDFSPSLRTIRKVCSGLDISVSSLFNSFELVAPSDATSRITTLLVGRPAAEIERVERVLTTMLECFDNYRSGR